MEKSIYKTNEGINYKLEAVYLLHNICEKCGEGLHYIGAKNIFCSNCKKVNDFIKLI